MNRPSLDKQTMELCDTFFCETIEYDLTNRYGKAKERIDAGLRWLFGNPFIPTYMDHPEYRVKDGKRTMDARPYGLSLKDIEALVKVAREKGIQLSITTPSNYNSSTVLIVLTEWTPMEGWQAKEKNKQ